MTAGELLGNPPLSHGESRRACRSWPEERRPSPALGPARQSASETTESGCFLLYCFYLPTAMHTCTVARVVLRMSVKFILLRKRIIPEINYCTVHIRIWPLFCFARHLDLDLDLDRQVKFCEKSFPSCWLYHSVGMAEIC